MSGGVNVRWWTLAIATGSLLLFIIVPRLHTSASVGLGDARKAMLQGNWTAVIDAVQQISEDSAEYAPAVLLHVEALLELDRPHAAWQLLEQTDAGISQLASRPLAKQPSERLSLKARAAFETGRLEAAFQCYGSLADDHTVETDAMRRLALIHRICGRRWESQKIYAALLRQGALNQNELVVLADLERPIDIGEMVAQWNSAAHDDPGRQLSQLAAQYTDGQTARLTSDLKDYVRAHPQDTGGQALLGQCLVQSVDFPIWFQNLPEHVRQNPDVWLACGRRLTRQSQPELAARCYWQALKLAPSSRRAHYELGQLLTSLDDPRAAHVTQRAQLLFDLAEHLDRLLTAPQDETALRQTAENLQQQGRLWEAAAWAVLAQQHNPNLRWPDQLRQTIISQLTPQAPLMLPAAQLVTEVDPPDWADIRDALTGADRTDSSVPQSDARPQFSSTAAGPAFGYRNGGDATTGGARMFEITGGGIGVLDFDRDQWPDLFFPQGGDWPPGRATPPETFSERDAIYRNHRGQGFALCVEAGIPAGGFGQGCAVGDFNNDGFADLLVANIGGNQLLLNLGDGTYRDVTPSAGLHRQDWTTSCGMADLDRDGTPDLFHVNYVTDEDVYTRVCQSHSCSPGVFQGVPDELLIGDGQGRFAAPSAASPVSAGNGLGLIIAGISDHDALDVFVANDQVQNAYLHNQTDVPGQLQLDSTALASGLAYSDDGLAMACMGIAGGDANGDGRLDLFVTNFRDEPNTLYLQNPGRLFVDATRISGLRGASLPYVGWGTQFLDADNDGRLDLAVVNGHVDPFPEEDGGYAMPTQLFHNRGQGTFTEIAPTTDNTFFSQRLVGRSLVRLDWNRDGRADLAVSTLESNAQLATNSTPDTGHWIRFALVGTQSARDAIGARITISTRVDTRSQQLIAGDGYMASNERCLLFGLGEARLVETVTVQWPCGAQTEFHDLEADCRYTLIEPQPPHAGRIIRDAP